MDNSFVEEVAASLVREFLSRKGLKKTSAIMDREFPRTALSINNRNELRNVLHLQSLYKQNKAKENPLKTILEVITNYFLEHFGTTRCITSPAASVLQAKSSQSRCIATSSVNDYSDEDMHGRTTVSDASKTEVYRYDIDVPLDKVIPSKRHQHKSEKSKTVVVPNSGSSSEGDKKSKNSRDDLKITETSEEMKTTMREKQRSRSGLIVRGMMAGPTASSQEVCIGHYDKPLAVGYLEVLEGRIWFTRQHSAYYKVSSLSVDFDDEATIGEVSRIPELSTLYTLEIVSKAIDISLAKEIKNLLFGSSLCCFSEEWKIQNFTFNSIPQLKYGIVQKQGGPCGVLAAVQACVLQQLLFGDSNRNSHVRCLQPSDAHRTKCLTLAIADILWRAGGNEKAVVWNFFFFQFETGPFGCILLTLSLMTFFLYCKQELVNLLLTGKAVSNVFNDVIELDSGNGNITVLKGITNRSDIGLLSLFEHYDVCQVGCYLKTPRYPIWVVCSESHFSVLFCLRKDLLGDWKTERRFDLYYYDGLANQEEEIRLTVDTVQPYTEDKENDLIPPLEHCIRTK
uniref:Ubiquitin carboxyl-terminal hydrolase MINDY n=1 Tax=Chrysemys picta bellii TaxID=8478 RepID=A0A8C3FAS2_CHRPI